MLCGFFLWLGLHGVPVAGFTPDDAIYLLMAEYFSNPTFDDGVLIYVQSVTHFPPLYPLFIAGLTQYANLHEQAFLVHSLCAVAACLTWALVISRHIEMRWRFTLIILSLALLPGTLLLTTALWSEFLYLLLIALAILCFERAEHHPSYIWFCAVAVGLAAATRGFGLVAAIALFMVLLRRSPRTSFAVLLITTLPVAFGHLLGYGGGSYVEIFLQRVDSFAAFESALRQNLAALGNGWLSLFAPHSPRLALAINCVFLPLALYGFTRRLFAWKFDAVYLGGYLALLLIWPFPHVIGRLAYGALPIVALHAVIGASHLTERFPGPGKCCTALLVVSVALGNGYSLYELSARYYSPDLPQSLHSWRASQAWLSATSPPAGIADLQIKQATIEILQQLDQTLPAKACVYSDFPQPVMLRARRASWPAPGGSDRPDTPECGFHLIVSDSTVRKSVDALWPEYEILKQQQTDSGPGALLVRYNNYR